MNITPELLLLTEDQLSDYIKQAFDAGKNWAFYYAYNNNPPKEAHDSVFECQRVNIIFKAIAASIKNNISKDSLELENL